MTVRRLILFFAFIPVLILVGFVKSSSAQEVVLYASQAPVKVGNWSAVGDSTAAGGARLSNTDFGAAKITTASASPADYVELSFNVTAGIPYRLWLRGKTLNNSPYNDSVFVQFSGSQNASGGAVYRIGTTSAAEVNLEDCSGCGLSGWGWQDNGWGIGVYGPEIYFQSSGTQTIRIQVREDGISIDQIVISPGAYLFNPPGALKNDNVILPASNGGSPAPTPTPTPTPTPNPTPTPATGESPNNTRIPPAIQIVDSTGAVWTRTATGAILRNGAGTSGAGSQVLYCNRIVYAFGTDSQWYKWSGGWSEIGTTDPCGGGSPTPTPTPTPGPLTESANNTRTPPSSQVVDSQLSVWTILNGAILKNGAGTTGTGTQILYCSRIVYVFGSDSNWWRWSNGWNFAGSSDPCGTTQNPPPTPTPTPANQPPTLTISATPTSGNSPLFVTFTSSANDPDGNITGYSWNLGNGATSGMPSTTTTYQSAGTYTATLTVIDNAGATTSKSVQINVSSPAPPPPPPSSSSLRVLSWNGSFGTGTDNVRDFDRTATYIASFNPDIAGICEIPSENIGYLVTSLQNKTGRTWYWYHITKYDGTTEGNLILSKYPFVSTSGRYLSYQRSVAQATINYNGRTINFFATHLDPDSSGARYQEVGELMDFASGFSESRIIVGDFNAGPDLSETVRMTSAYYDSWVRAMNAGSAVSYPDNPVYLMTRTRRGRIDYVYYSLSSPYLVLQSTQIPDTRNLSQTNVVVWLGTTDDKGVRPSDHNPMIANFIVQ